MSYFTRMASHLHRFVRDFLGFVSGLLCFASNENYFAKECDRIGKELREFQSLSRDLFERFSALSPSSPLSSNQPSRRYYRPIRLRAGFVMDPLIDQTRLSAIDVVFPRDEVAGTDLCGSGKRLIPFVYVEEPHGRTLR